MSSRKTVKMSKKDLKYLLIDSLKKYSEDVIYIGGANPYAFNINKKVAYIFMRNLHSSGSGRPNPDESRIQVPNSKNFIDAINSGKPVFFFGYLADLDVFTAWDPIGLTPRINKKKVISVYSRFTVQESAARNGISCYEYYQNDIKKIAISFRPEYLGLYLENFSEMHQSDERILLELVKKSDQSLPTEKSTGESVEIERKRFVITHRKFKRDPNFTKAVYEAYDERCAVCGIQLDLVVAAHIIPHAHEKGNDETCNGVCLCELHHAAYDTGLIYFDEDYLVKINGARVKYLEKMRRDGGITKFKELQDERLGLPRFSGNYPSKMFIREANHIRGIIGR